MVEKVCMFEEKKFMWDGKEYETEEEAKNAEKEYLKNDFEVRSVSEGGKVFLYTRRVVTEIVLDEQP